jgi:hypothetical protein
MQQCKNAHHLESAPFAASPAFGINFTITLGALESLKGRILGNVKFNDIQVVFAIYCSLRF